MPELPEVETVRRALERAMRGCAITRVEIRRRDAVVFPGDPAGGFGRNTRAGSPPPRPVRARPDLLLRGGRVAGVSRHGKALVVEGAPGGPAVAIHLGMSGQVLVVPPGVRRADPGHVHVSWTLERDGAAAGRVWFRDPRRFGGVWGFPSREALNRAMIDPLGPDALSVSAGRLHEALTSTRGGRARRRPLKAALLDQRTLAGVGNIYADESLFRAGLAPHRPTDSLTRDDTARLAAAIREVLRAAIGRGGSTLRDYRTPDGQPGNAQDIHAVYGRAGLACVRCGGVLAGGVVAQRTTVWCARCQAG